jgi:hypothetical protein
LSAAARRASDFGHDQHVSRSLRLALIVLAVLVFFVVSGVLARFLSVENAERDAALSLLRAQAAGNVQGMLRKLPDCQEHRSCLLTVEHNAANLRRAGVVKILTLKSPTAYSLTGASGRTRIAWTVIGRLPVVQCLSVRRSGNFLTGVSVTLLSLSAPIANTGDC